MNVLNGSKDWDEESLTGSLASLAHLAYHLGAIRNMLGVAKQRST
jgi:hypothetical protein